MNLYSICATPLSECFNSSFSNLAEATKDKTGLFTCTESGCVRSYSSKQSLTRHLKHDHGQVAPQSGRFVCEVCDKRYTLAKELINHYKTHGVNIGMAIMALYTNTAKQV